LVPVVDGTCFLAFEIPSAETIFPVGIRQHPHPKIKPQKAVNVGTSWFRRNRRFFFCRYPAVRRENRHRRKPHFKKEEMMKKNRALLALGLVMIFVFFTAMPAMTAETTFKININTATVDELAQLKRVGPAYAARIVEYREQNGPFENVEDIMKVRGIGPKTWEANKDTLSVE
jgi:competence protein ComEA